MPLFTRSFFVSASFCCQSWITRRMYSSWVSGTHSGCFRLVITTRSFFVERKTGHGPDLPGRRVNGIRLSMITLQRPIALYGVVRGIDVEVKSRPFTFVSAAVASWAEQ